MSLVSKAYASGAPATVSQGFNITQFVPMIVIFALFWFLLIRPQQKKVKLHNQMISELQKGDEVVLSNGIVGTINKVLEQFILLNIGKDVVLTVQKSSVGAKLEKGTIDKIN